MLTRARQRLLDVRESRRASNDAGITMAEMVVAMALGTILGTMAVIFFVATVHASNKTVLSNQSTADARVTLDNWTSMLRVAGWLDPNTQADRFEEITPTKIVFYANLKNRTTSDATLGAPTKVALMLRISDTSTGQGQLIQIVFKPDNTTPLSVRQLGINASQTTAGGVANPVFQPVLRTGGTVDMTTKGCLSGSTPVVGLCLQGPQPNSGMVDPSVATTSLAVAAGPLRGLTSTIDSTLAQVGGIVVAFTATDPHSVAPVDFVSSASVTSGYPAS